MQKKITIDLTDPAYSGLTNVGNAITKDNLIIINVSTGNYVALSKQCTHQGCTVGFNGTEIVCPCHGSKFTTAGAVIQGPATTALAKYKTELTGDILTITL
ncbi:MAG: Rieske (2Fe-2S) protein [Bacteroidales bacterium]|nr:Rieske (2Fe-2S) protein [Bacteroidales bacterium]